MVTVLGKLAEVERELILARTTRILIDRAVSGHRPGPHGRSDRRLRCMAQSLPPLPYAAIARVGLTNP
jgi:DNA invertase Pin-like site-specific DNA recombinase